MKIIKLALVFLISSLVYSCEKDELFSPADISADQNAPISSYFDLDESGERIHFNSLSDFQEVSSLVRKAQAPEAAIVELVEPAVKRGTFLPLYPFYEVDKIDSRTVDLYVSRASELQAFMNEVKNVSAKSVEEGVEFDQYIHDEFLLSILNINGEVSIGDKIYHYLPYGLFITSSQKGVNKLDEISTNPEQARSLLTNAVNHLGQTFSIAEGLDFYIPEKGENTINNWFFPEKFKDHKVEFDKDLNQNLLTLCSIRSLSIFNSVFGPSTYCIDDFDRRRRLKTRVFDQNYFIVQSIGMSAKAQIRTFRAWWALRVDELELGCEYLDFQFPPGFEPPPTRFFRDPILGARLSDGTFIGFNGEVINSGPLFDKMRDISANLEFIPQIERDDLQIRIFVKFLDLNETFEPSDFLDFKEIVNNLIDDQVPTFFRRIETCFDGEENCFFNPREFDNQRLEFINMGNERIQVTVQPIERNRSNIANMAHYFDVNTGQFGISGSVGDLGPDLTNSLNTFDYDILRSLVWGAGRRGSTLRGNYVATTLDN